MLPLLLRNGSGSVDQNSCYSNSIIQVLRRIPNIKDVILALPSETNVETELKRIFLKEGSISQVSSYPLRAALRPDFARGNQMDSKEFFDTLLQALPLFMPVFNFKIRRTYRFVSSRNSAACNYCHPVEDPVIQGETSLILPLYNAQELVLQNLIDIYFQFEADFKKCSRCSTTNQQPYQVFKDFIDPGMFLFIQPQRFKRNVKNNKLEKIQHYVQGSHHINVGNYNFKLVAIVNHIGTFSQGHFQALLESNGKWYECDDYHLPREIITARESIFSQFNYLYVYEKNLPTSLASQSQSASQQQSSSQSRPLLQPHSSPFPQPIQGLQSPLLPKPSLPLPASCFTPV